MSISLNRFYFEFRLQNVIIVMENHLNFLKCSRLLLSNKTGIIRCSTYTTDQGAYVDVEVGLVRCEKDLVAGEVS